MTLKALVTEICSKEGKLKEVSVGNVREIVGIVSDYLYLDDSLVKTLQMNGRRRSKRKKK